MVTAIILGHSDTEGIRQVYEQLQPQVDETIVITCCEHVDLGDINIRVGHRDDWGQSKCDMGLRLASKDYVMFASSDDNYLPDFIEGLSGYDEDLILGGFRSHLVGEVKNSTPVIGGVTRGSFLARRELAQQVGYNHHDYNGDGKFIQDMVSSGATWVSVPVVNYLHK